MHGAMVVADCSQKMQRILSYTVCGQIFNIRKILIFSENIISISCPGDQTVRRKYDSSDR